MFFTYIYIYIYILDSHFHMISFSKKKKKIHMIMSGLFDFISFSLCLYKFIRVSIPWPSVVIHLCIMNVITTKGQNHAAYIIIY